MTTTTLVTSHQHNGFTLLESLVAVALLLVFCGAMFGLLGTSQRRYQTESQVLYSFQDERLCLDQIVRDANDSGYPPSSNFSATPAVTASVYSPIAWSPNYTVTPCQIGTAGGGTCTTPGDFDVIFEENYDNTTVKWIRYQLVGTTLFRGVVVKSALDPAAATAVAGVMLPYITNVMNNASAAQITQFQQTYPSMFPGGNPQPIFQFSCATPGGSPVLCQNAGANNSPQNVSDVEVTLIVKAPQADMQSSVPRLVELNGRGHRVNPN